jgi:hypothetical protein
MAASIITPSSTLTSPAMQRDLHDIRAVEIDIGRVYSGDGVLIRASSSRWGSPSPLVVKLADHDQTRFEGLTRQLREMLQPRERLGVAWFRDWWPPAYLVGAVVTIAGVGLARQGDKHMSNPGQGVASVGSGALVVGLLVLLLASMPDFELLAATEKPRFVRWRRRIAAAFATVILGVVAGVIVAVITG